MNKKKNEKGQTMVEYVLLLAVMISILVPLFKKFEGAILTNNNSFVKTYLKSFENAFFEGNYRYFTIKR